MKKNTKLQFKRALAVILTFTMLMSMTACRTPNEFYHEVILGETIGNKPNKDKDKDKDKEEKTTEEATEDDASLNEPEPEYADTENEEFEDFLWEYFKDSVTSDTLNYKSLISSRDSYPDIQIEEATLGDARMDAAAVEEAKEKDNERYEKLLSFEDAELTEDERFTFECMKRDMEISLHIYDNIYFYEPFSPGRGAQENLTSNFTDYTFDNKQDVDDYITVLGQVREYFGDLIEFEYEKSEKGYFMSDAVADKVIEQCDEFTKSKDDHVLVTDFDERIDAVDFLSDEEKEDYKNTNKEIVLNIVIPSYDDLKNCLEELKGTGKNDGGICGFEGGKEYYRDYYFPKLSGSAKTPEEEIKIMDERWDNLLVELSSIYYSNPDAYDWAVEHGDEAFATYDDMEVKDLVDLLQDKYMDDFPLDQKIPFEIKFMSDSVSKISENTVAYYQVCPVDNPNKNLIVVNPAFEDDRFNTLAHEGTPGHMFQFWYFRNTNPNPGRQLAFNLGYIEGWAVYASYQAQDNCDFEGENEYGSIVGKIMRIDTDLNYLMLGRADLGINYEGWGVDEVADYLTGKVAEGKEKEVAEDLITSLASDPGLYLSYTTGFYEMEEMREYAEDKLGSKFDAKEYHKTVLDAGPCQFELLKKKVDKYIKENK